jgi:hypothetical protein
MGGTQKTKTRYKGRQGAKASRKISRTSWIWSFPKGAKRLGAMYEFHTQYAIKPLRAHGRYDANGSVIRWCIADEEIAKSFAIVFGERVTIKETFLLREEYRPMW